MLLRTKHMPQDDCAGRMTLARIAATFAVLLSVLSSPARAADDVWSSLRGDLFGERKIGDGAGMLSLEAPKRAHDAALVPVSIKTLLPKEGGREVRRLTLVIDQNPAPVAAVFHFAPASGIESVATRLRVNSYSHVRVIAELDDGTLHMVKRFVKASGGCSAPASKDAKLAKAQMGRMKLREFPLPPARGTKAAARSVQVMIRHPNNSGLQMDQLTGYYIPAQFVSRIDVTLGGRALMQVEGAISLSEDPSLRFTFRDHQSGSIEVRAEDTERNIFKRSWKLQATAQGT